MFSFFVTFDVVRPSRTGVCPALTAHLLSARGGPAKGQLLVVVAAATGSPDLAWDTLALVADRVALGPTSAGPPTSVGPPTATAARWPRPTTAPAPGRLDAAVYRFLLYKQHHMPLHIACKIIHCSNFSGLECFLIRLSLVLNSMFESLLI